MDDIFCFLCYKKGCSGQYCSDGDFICDECCNDLVEQGKEEEKIND